MPELKFVISSHVEKGKLSRNRKTLAQTIRQFEGKEIQITIERKRKKRSNRQNRYYFGVIVLILKQCLEWEWGERIDIETAHDVLKTNCNYKEIVNENTGEIIRVPQSTAVLNTGESEDYYENCRQFIRRLFNTEVPLPNEEIELKL